MKQSLMELCDLAHQHGHRQPVPEHENTYLFYRSEKTKYLYFVHRDVPKEKQLSGWKFHISVHHEDCEKAWDLMQDALFHEDMGSLLFGAVDIFYCAKHEYTRTHNQFVLYTLNDARGRPLQSPEYTYALLLRVNRLLQDANIRPGKCDSASLRVPQLRYISTRNDLDPVSREFIHVDFARELNSARAYNPHNVRNPYAWFVTPSNSNRQFILPKDELVTSYEDTLRDSLRR